MSTDVFKGGFSVTLEPQVTEYVKSLGLDIKVDSKGKVTFPNYLSVTESERKHLGRYLKALSILKFEIDDSSDVEIGRQVANFVGNTVVNMKGNIDTVDGHILTGGAKSRKTIQGVLIPSVKWALTAYFRHGKSTKVTSVDKDSVESAEF